MHLLRISYMICEFALGYSRFLVTWYLWCTSELDKIQGRPVSVCVSAHYRSRHSYYVVLVLFGMFFSLPVHV